MKTRSDKLKRLVRAQSITESLTTGEVTHLAAELTDLEQQLDSTQSAFSSTEVTLIFSDFYIRHLHRLQTRYHEVQQLLEAAQIKLQNETIRSRKLKKHLHSALQLEIQDREIKDTLERVERNFSTKAARF